MGGMAPRRIGLLGASLALNLALSLGRSGATEAETVAEAAPGRAQPGLRAGVPSKSLARIHQRPLSSIICRLVS